MNPNNLKELRIEFEITQKQIADTLGFNRSTYNSWERNTVMIPIEEADKIAMYYKVKLACVLGIEKEIIVYKNIQPINYKRLLINLRKLKSSRKQTFNTIAKSLSCSSVTAQRYFKGTTIIPIDRLIKLTRLYNIDLDELCGKLQNDVNKYDFTK